MPQETCLHTGIRTAHDVQEKQDLTKMQKVRAAQREGLEGMRGVTWIDMFPLSSDANGRWLEEGADVNGNPINYRREDGIHLTPAGGQLVGRRLLERLMERGLTLCGDG